MAGKACKKVKKKVSGKESKGKICKKHSRKASNKSKASKIKKLIKLAK